MMAILTIHRIACDFCPAVMRGRADERLADLWARAERSGWKRLVGMRAGKHDACQVCAPKVSY